MKLFIAGIIASALLTTSYSAIADTSSDTIALVKSTNADCLQCHKIEKKLIGPAWKDVAAKYKADPTAQSLLVEKVIKGGKGHWDDQTGGYPMTPHPTKPTREELEKIIALILQIQ
jgi:cytochrome c